MSNRKAAKRKYVSATQLAAVATCERRVLLAQRHGARTTPAQRASMRRGVSVHARVAHSSDTGDLLDDLYRYARTLIRRVLNAMTRLALEWGASK